MPYLLVANSAIFTSGKQCQIYREGVWVIAAPATGMLDVHATNLSMTTGEDMEEGRYKIFMVLWLWDHNNFFDILHLHFKHNWVRLLTGINLQNQIISKQMDTWGFFSSVETVKSQVRPWLYCMCETLWISNIRHKDFRSLVCPSSSSVRLRGPPPPVFWNGLDWRVLLILEKE